MNVFDTSAVLAVLYEEPGRGVAASRLDRAAISTVNAAEVLGDYVASGRGDLPTALRAFEALGLALIAPDYEQSVRAAELKRPRLSLGDRFCLALAEAQGDRVVTADQDWSSVPLSVPIEFIR